MSTSPFFSLVEQFATQIVVGVAHSDAPLSAIDPAHPVVTAAADAAQLAGAALGLAVPGAKELAPVLLALAQMFTTPRVPAS